MPIDKGVYRYEEADTSATASQMLNKLADSVRKALPLAGTIEIVPDAANVTKIVRIDFPAGSFQETPAITLSGQTAGPAAIHLAYGGPSASGFSIYAERSSTTPFNVSWIAAPRR